MRPLLRWPLAYVIATYAVGVEWLVPQLCTTPPLQGGAVSLLVPLGMPIWFPYTFLLALAAIPYGVRATLEPVGFILTFTVVLFLSNRHLRRSPGRVA
jgi:hypothetical protein